MIHTTLEQMKGLVLVFYLGCLGGTFYFLEENKKFYLFIFKKSGPSILQVKDKKS